MKCYTQVYVSNSMEAVELYCRAFDAEVTFAVKTKDQTQYEHCELSVQGQPVLAVAQAAQDYDVKLIHQLKWQTMTFNAFELGSVEAVERAFRELKTGGVVVEEIHKLPWSECCATVIDKFGVCWWISI